MMMHETRPDPFSHDPFSVIGFSVGESTLGSILVAASEIGVCVIALGDNPDRLVKGLEARFPKAEFIGEDRGLDPWVDSLVGFVEVPAGSLDLPLDIHGTPFQQRVWQALQKIAVGERVSYSDIAQRIGSPTAVRAVASACAANPLALVIPCHRVVRSDGRLSGYRWGVERKAEMLRRERRP